MAERIAHLPMQYRMTLVGDDGKEVRAETRGEGDEAYSVYDIAISSEEPVEREDWWTGERYFEVLGHGPGEVDLSRLQSGAAVMEDHRPPQVGGIADGSVRIGDDRVLRAGVRFSKGDKGPTIEKDVRDKIRRGISVGYNVVEYAVTKNEGGLKTYRATRWQPMEVSIVAVPADYKQAGVGRSAGDSTRFPVTIRGEDPGRERIEMPENERGKGAPAVPDAGAVAVASESARQEGVDLARKDAGLIVTMAVENGYPEKAGDWIARGLAVGDVACEILDLRKSKAGGAQPGAERIVETPDDIADKFSYARAILVAAGEFKGGCPEKDFHEEAMRNTPEGYRYRGGTIVPLRLRKRPERIQRAVPLNSMGGTVGAELVFDRPGELIDLLRAQTVVLRNGARLLTGLTAPIAFPKLTGGTTVYWVAENPATEVPESEMSFGIVILTPKTMMGTTAYSRQLLAVAPSSGLDVEQMVREDMSLGHSLAFDRAGIHGRGTNGEPCGIFATPDVLAKTTFGAVTFAKLVDMVGAIADANALMGQVAWATTPILAAKLMARLVASAAGSEMIWRGTFDNGTVAGYTARATNQVSKTMALLAATGGTDHGLIVGVWPNMILGTWGGLELIVDPLAQKKKGLIEVTSFQMGDVVIRYPQSFCVGSGVTIADP